MATFALIHGAGDVGWYWHLVESELRARGHRTVAPDLPCEDDSAGLAEYVETVVGAVGRLDGDPGGDLVVVGQSLGAYPAPLVADRLPVRMLVLVAGMIPAPGEAADDWGERTGYRAAVAGRPIGDDVVATFYHDVPADLVEQARSRSRGQSGTPMAQPWPRDAWPDVPTRFVLGTQDRLFPADFLRDLARRRLNVDADELPAGHCMALSRPTELADVLSGYLT